MNNKEELKEIEEDFKVNRLYEIIGNMHLS